MEEKTLFKLARAITDTGTDTVSSDGGTVTYRITSLKRKLVNGKVTQGSMATFTLQGLTPNSNYFLFASGHFPSSNTYMGYLMIMENGSKITLHIPCTVNMSIPGQRSEADTGDRVSVYPYSNNPFVSAGSFTVPSAGGTVSI